MMVNTDSAMKPNSFRPIPESRSASSRNNFHRLVALDITMASSLPKKGRSLASQETVRAQDQRSSSIEI